MSDKALPPVPLGQAPTTMEALREDAETSSSDTAHVADPQSTQVPDGMAGARVDADEATLDDADLRSQKMQIDGRDSQAGQAMQHEAAPAALPARRPLVFHRSLTSPSPSSKLGALRHPSRQVLDNGLVTIGEGTANAPFSHAQQHAGVERRNTQPLEPVSVSNDASSLTQATLPALRRSDDGHRSLEISSPDWSISPPGSGDRRKNDLVTHRIPGIAGMGVSKDKHDMEEAKDAEVGAAAMRREPVESPIAASPPATRQRSTSLDVATHAGVDSVFADTLQLPISTLLQLIPPHLLDPSHERLSASSLQVPVTSIQALLESCRTLNWLCTNHEAVKRHKSSTKGDPSPASQSQSAVHSGRDFDISELVQRTCDVVSGQAAEKDIDIVLLQDVENIQHAGAKYFVNGDEDTLRYIVLKTLAYAAEIAPPRSIIETSLEVDAMAGNSDTVRCTLNVLLLKPNGESSSRPSPALPASQSDQLPTIAPFVKALGGKMTSLMDAGSALTINDALTVRLHQSLSLPLKNAVAPMTQLKLAPDEEQARQRFLPALRLAEEPAWEDLSRFVTQTLSGSRIALHGDPNTSFVRHLISFFASCHCELAILSTQDRTFGDSAVWAATPTSEKTKELQHRHMSTRTAVALTGNRPSIVSYPSGVGMGDEVARGLENSTNGTSGSALLDPVTGVPVSIGPLSKDSPMERSSFAAFSFVLIDDDLDVLQHELLRIRSAVATLRSALPAQTPSTETEGTPSPSTHAIIFFFSLLNYRPVRDAIQAIVESSEQSRAPLPEILMVPKPCGSRRLLTALHTAWEKPLVDPFFSPIATSPMCPTSRGVHKDLWGSVTSPPTGQSARIPATTPPRADEFSTPMKRESRMSNMHIDIPPRPSYKEDVVKEVKAADVPAKEGPSVKVPVITESAGDVLVHQGSDGSVARSLLSVQQEIASPKPQPEDVVLPRPSMPDRRKTNSSKKSQNLLTPHSTSNPSSHAASSPMMTDALEYFSETAAKISDDGAAGFMIQSPDGRPAGIFFQPRKGAAGSSRASNASRRTGHAQRSSAEGSMEMLRSRHASEGSGGDRGSMPLLSLKEIVDSGRSAEEPTSADMQRDATNSTAKGASTDSATPASATKKSTTPDVAAGQAQVTALPLDSSAPQGKMYTPQVGIQSILAAELPLAAVRAQAAEAKVSDASGQADGAVEASQGTTAGGPKEVRLEEAPSSFKMAPESSPVSRVPLAPVTPNTRPSAQPQAGVLIGAGFQPTRKRMSALNAKKAAKDIEVLPPIKVLIVDDNPINVKILSTWLEKRKIKIGVARDGREAVREWQTGGYQLILMDIQLPVMDGIEATKVIRRLEREASIDSASSPSVASAASKSVKELGAATTPADEASSPQNMLSSSLRSSVIIVALTASVLNSDRVAALAAGCNDFLNKPVNMRWLERKVTEWGSMQYLIGYRSLNGVEEASRNSVANRSRKGSAQGRDGSLLHPANALGGDSSYSNDTGMVKRAFGHAPEKLARDVADRLHIGETGRRQKVQ